MIRIILVEDDSRIASSIQYYLGSEGFHVDTADTAEVALMLFAREAYQLVLLDVTLPDGDGFELYRRLKSERDVPVIFLTALDEEEHVVKGFELGADDYIKKPFHARELLSRIKNVLRHTGTQGQAEDVLRAGSVELCPAKGAVYRDGKALELTALEYKILLLLMENKGRILTRTQILANIWDESENFVNDNTLTVYIKRLREKIGEDPNHPQIIRTVRGMGYKIDS